MLQKKQGLLLATYVERFGSNSLILIIIISQMSLSDLMSTELDTKEVLRIRDENKRVTNSIGVKMYIECWLGVLPTPVGANFDGD